MWYWNWKLTNISVDLGQLVEKFALFNQHVLPIKLLDNRDTLLQHSCCLFFLAKSGCRGHNVNVMDSERCGWLLNVFWIWIRIKLEESLEIVRSFGDFILLFDLINWKHKMVCYSILIAVCFYSSLPRTLALSLRMSNRSRSVGLKHWKAMFWAVSKASSALISSPNNKRESA